MSFDKGRMMSTLRRSFQLALFTMALVDWKRISPHKAVQVKHFTDLLEIFQLTSTERLLSTNYIYDELRFSATQLEEVLSSGLILCIVVLYLVHCSLSIEY